MLAWIARLGQWLKGLFFEQDSLNLYQPKERLVYGYYNGKETVYADPMELHRKLTAEAAELDIDIKVACSPLKDAPKAFATATAKIRQIFSLPPFAQGGLSEVEVMDLLAHFLVYCHNVKKKANVTVTSPAGVSPSSLPSTDAAPTTTSTSDSTSTAAVSSTNTPVPLPSEPALPSA